MIMIMKNTKEQLGSFGLSCFPSERRLLADMDGGR